MRRAARSCKTSTSARRSSEAIDYDGAIESLVAGKGKKQASPIPNGFIGSADLALPEFNLDDAKKLLSDAGLADGFDLDATYPDANVYGVDFNLMMQKIQQDLAKVEDQPQADAGPVPRMGRRGSVTRGSPSLRCTSPPTTPTPASTSSTSA